MSCSVFVAPSHVLHVNAEFQQTLTSIEDFTKVMPDGSHSGKFAALELSSTLNRLERDYSESIVAFRSVLHSLFKREKAARRTLRALPSLRTFDVEGLSKLEADINNTLESLNETDLDSLEVGTSAEAAAVEALELRNVRRRREIASPHAESAPAVRTAAYGRQYVHAFPATLAALRKVSMDDVG
jgi:hypothetical protein